jgi:hypothetical protein
MQSYKISNVTIREDGYIGGYGWYWQPSAIAGIVFRAFQDNLPSYMGSLEDTTVYVSELFKHDACDLSNGCHDTIYSVFVKVSSVASMLTVEQIYDAYKSTNAQFNVEPIHGGYHFYKTW